MKAEKLRKQLLKEMQGKASNREVRRLKSEIEKNESNKQK